MVSAVLALVLAGLLGATAIDASAQEGTQAQTQAQVPERRAGIEQITVTARKRSEAAQDVPVALTAFTANDLAEQGITDVGDIRLSTPNLQFLRGFDATNSSRVYIRGVGQDDVIATSDAGVGLYVDGVYLGRSQSSLFELLDIERIEVLRGPQGTLYGKNTIGGAVNVVTSKPTGEWGGKLTLRGGNYQLFETKGSIDFPILDEVLAGRISFATSTRDGFSHNTFQDNDWNDKKLLAGRGTLRFTPTESLDVTLVGERIKQHQKTGYADCTFVNPSAGLYGLLTLTEYSGFAAACDSTIRDSQLKFGFDAPNRGDTDVAALSATADYQLTEDVSFKSISSWRRNDYSLTFDVENSPVHLLTIQGEPSRIDQFSQELQLTGTSFDGKLDWVGGLYWFREYGNDDRITSIAPLAHIGIPCEFLPLAPGFTLCDLTGSPVGTTGIPLEALTGPLGSDSRLRIDNRSSAAFGQATFHLTDRIALTGGARFTHERKAIDIVTRCNSYSLMTVPAACTSPSVEADAAATFGAWTPMANVSFDLTDDVMIYGGWSRGFKSGGFNGRAATNFGAHFPFEPEFVSAWEAGFKSSWLDNSVILNGAYFYSKYDDVQVATVEVVGTDQFVVTKNAAKGTIQGFELEAHAQPVTGLDLSASWGVIDASLDEFNDIIGGVPRDRSGEDFRNTPDWSYNLAAQYTLPLGRLGDLTARAEYYKQASSWAAQEITDNWAARNLARQHAYAIVNARLGLQLPDGNTEVAFWGRNLTNTVYLTSFAAIHGAFGSLGRVYSEPRFYGVEIIRNF